MTTIGSDSITTRIWLEESEDSDRYATKVAYCHGFDVYRSLVGRVSLIEMLYLMLCGEAPTRRQASLLEALAVGLANPGPRDLAVHAAMSSGVTGAPGAASLMAALAVGAGRLGGARDVYEAMRAWRACGTDFDAWPRSLMAGAAEELEIWLPAEHAPGFDPNTKNSPGIVIDFLARLCAIADDGRLVWMRDHRACLEAEFQKGLSMAGVASAALSDIGLSPAQGEVLYLLLRLPGAMAHALEQRERKFTEFPFGDVVLELDNRKTQESQR